jgi:hypothetical protein
MKTSNRVPRTTLDAACATSARRVHDFTTANASIAQIERDWWVATAHANPGTLISWWPTHNRTLGRLARRGPVAAGEQA